jgi:hypothetical protein
MKNYKQIVLLSHPRSGSTYLLHLLERYFNVRFYPKLRYSGPDYGGNFVHTHDLIPDVDWHPGELKDYRNVTTTNTVVKSFYDYNEKDIYTVWKIMINDLNFKMDYQTIGDTTNLFSIGRKNWKHTVISLLKSKQTGIWNSLEEVDAKEFDHLSVEVEDIIYVCKLISHWYNLTKNLTKKYEVTNIWYEDLIFTTKDLEIFGFDYDNLHALYDVNTINDDLNLVLTKKVTKLSDYERFDEMLKSKNIRIDKLLKATNLPIDKNNQNLLTDIC